MPRFITVTVACDRDDCTITGAEGDGTVIERTLAIDGKQARAFLLCKQHLEDLDEILLPLMQAGVKVEEPTKKKRSPGGTGSNGSGTAAVGPAAGPEGARDPSTTIDCLITGCKRTGSNGLHNRTGMAQHVIRTHNYESLAAYEAEFGIVD
jgi:hypothetical protein